jgi:hypothetical protein
MTCLKSGREGPPRARRAECKEAAKIVRIMQWSADGSGIFRRRNFIGISATNWMQRFQKKENEYPSSDPVLALL